MSWLAQVAHVARKDLAQERWPLLVYLGILALVTYTATRTGYDSDVVFLPLDIVSSLLLLGGLVATCSVVQGDSPVDARAFWRSRPLDALAVLAAKLTLLFGLGVVLPMACQVLALMRHGASTEALPALMFSSLSTVGVVLLGALVASALTIGMTTFFGVMTVSTILGFLAGGYLSAAVMAYVLDHGSLPRMSGLHSAIQLFWVVLVVTIVATVYRRRDIHRMRWLVVMVALFGPSVGVVKILNGAFEEPSYPTAPSGTPQVALHIKTLHTGAVADSEAHGDGEDERTGANFSTMRAMEFGPGTNIPDEIVSLMVRSDTGVAGLRQELVSFRARVTLPNGRSSYALNRNPSLHLSNAVTAKPGVSWIGPVPPLLQWLVLSVPQRKAPTMQTFQTGARWTIDAKVAVLEPTVVAELPLKLNSAFTYHGRRYHMVKSSSYSRAPWTLSFAAIELETESFFSRQSNDSLEFALVNETRHEAVHLVGESGYRYSRSLVLPGPSLAGGMVPLRLLRVTASTRGTVAASARDSTAPRAQTSAQATPPSPIDAAWLRDAHLLVIHWTPRYAYPVHAEYIVP